MSKNEQPPASPVGAGDLADALALGVPNFHAEVVDNRTIRVPIGISRLLVARNLPGGDEHRGGWWFAIRPTVGPPVELTRGTGGPELGAYEVARVMKDAIRVMRDLDRHARRSQKTRTQGGALGR